MTLATVDADGMPNARMVLLKGADERGFVFYTNMDSQKGRELDAQRPRPRWCSTGNRSTGRCACAARSSASPTPRPTPISPRRPKQAQIGAWASKQSSPLESRLAFEKAVALYAAKYALGTVPRPPYWSGYRIVPLAIEFWQDRPFRLHDRIEFRRAAPGRAVEQDAALSVS